MIDCFIKLFFKSCFVFLFDRASPGVPEYIPAECQKVFGVEEQRVMVLVGCSGVRS
jgi:hypothetical protein